MGFKYLALIFLSVSVSLAKFPELSVDAEEIRLLDNESLEFICAGSNPKIIFPTNVTIIDIPTSSVEIIEDRERGQVLLRRNKTVYGDTGWYGCVDSYDFPSKSPIEYENITPDNFHKIDARWANISVKWIYVYVKSSEHSFVQPLETVESIHVGTGDDIVLSCRPTSPDFTVRLFQDTQEINLNSRVSFDPKRGFTLKNVGIKDSGYYQCVISESSEEVSYYVHVTRRTIPQKPIIRGFSWERLINDREVSMNCSIETRGDIAFILEWKTPQSSKINSGPLIKEVIGNSLIRYTNKLTIQNFTHAEEGIYECTHTTHFATKSTSKNITLADAELHLKTQKSIDIEEKKKNYTEGYLVPVFVGLNCSDKAELSPASVEILKNSIINEIKRNLTDIISNAVKDSFEKYLMSVFSSVKSENPLISSKLGPVISPYYSTPRSYQNSTESSPKTTPYYYPIRNQNSTGSVTATTPYYYSTRRQNSTEPSVTETTPHYYISFKKSKFYRISH